MMKNKSRGPKNLFDLDDFSNYKSSNYMSSTVYKKPRCEKSKILKIYFTELFEMSAW